MSFYDEQISEATPQTNKAKLKSKASLAKLAKNAKVLKTSRS